MVSFSVVLADTTSPSVTLTSPSDGSTVSGVIQLSADALDNVAVAGVQFLLDGAPVRAEDITAPYGISLDTSALSGRSPRPFGPARDTSGNFAVSSSVTIEVVNDNDPAQIGQWSSVMNWPLVAINMVLMNNGKVLMWDGG